MYSVFVEKNGLVVSISGNVPVSRLLKGMQKEFSDHMVTPWAGGCGSLVMPPQVPKDSASGLESGQMLQVPMKQGATVLLPSVQCLRNGEEWEAGWCLQEGDDVC